MALAGIRFDRKICALLYKTFQVLKWKPINKKNLHCLKPVFCSSLAACWGVKGNLCGLLGRSKETPDRMCPQLCLLLPLLCTEAGPSRASSGVPSTPSAEPFFEHLLGGSTVGQWLEDLLLLPRLLGRFLLGSPLGFGKRLEMHLPPPWPWALHGRTEPLFYSVTEASEGTLWAGGQGEREKLTRAQLWCHSALHQPSQWVQGKMWEPATWITFPHLPP